MISRVSDKGAPSNAFAKRMLISSPKMVDEVEDDADEEEDVVRSEHAESVRNQSIFKDEDDDAHEPKSAPSSFPLMHRCSLAQYPQ